MFNRCCIARIGFMSIVAALFLAVPPASALAQCGGHGGMGGHGGHGGMGGHDHAAAGDSHAGHSEHQYHMPPGELPRRAKRTPHGGLFLETGSHSLEVVYLPRETRVYLYEKSGQPLSTLALRGEMSPQVRGESSPRHIPLQHVLPSGPKEQDFLVAATDVSQLPDETPITFRFENLPDHEDRDWHFRPLALITFRFESLPDRQHPKAEFTPIFYQSEIRPYVARVSFVQADREGLAGQQVCPITGARLGSMGEPAKVLVGERPLYLCCAGCIEKVKETASIVSAQPFPTVGR